MAIKHTAVSYYGLNYVEHAKKDFEEMKEHGCDTVILAITEFDMDFWFPNINNIVKCAHELGLRVIGIIFTTDRFPHTRERFFPQLASTQIRSEITSRESA